MTSDKLSNEAKVRIQTMCDTNDGFKIAEVDLQLRGPGDIAGTQQSGSIEFSIADLTTDGEILREARKVVEGLFADDPDLTKPVSRQLVAVYNEQHKHRKHWSRIS
jgi:ATP-dependent DNA helicase RecG